LSFVLGNSVALAWCFDDERTPAVLGVLDRLVETGASAPMLWPLEANNGLLLAERRQRLDGTQRVQLAAFLSKLPVWLDMKTAEPAWGDTARLIGAYAKPPLRRALKFLGWTDAFRLIRW
jgi:hypothetical protein